MGDGLAKALDLDLEVESGDENAGSEQGEPRTFEHLGHERVDHRNGHIETLRLGIGCRTARVCPHDARTVDRHGIGLRATAVDRHDNSVRRVGAR